LRALGDQPSNELQQMRETSFALEDGRHELAGRVLRIRDLHATVALRLPAHALEGGGRRAAHARIENDRQSIVIMADANEASRDRAFDFNTEGDFLHVADYRVDLHVCLSLLPPRAN